MLITYRSEPANRPAFSRLPAKRPWLPGWAQTGKPLECWAAIQILFNPFTTRGYVGCDDHPAFSRAMARPSAGSRLSEPSQGGLNAAGLRLAKAAQHVLGRSSLGSPGRTIRGPEEEGVYLRDSIRILISRSVPEVRPMRTSCRRSPVGCGEGVLVGLPRIHEPVPGRTPPGIHCSSCVTGTWNPSAAAKRPWRRCAWACRTTPNGNSSTPSSRPFAPRAEKHHCGGASAACIRH